MRVKPRIKWVKHRRLWLLSTREALKVDPVHAAYALEFTRMVNSYNIFCPRRRSLTSRS